MPDTQGKQHCQILDEYEIYMQSWYQLQYPIHNRTANQHLFIYSTYMRILTCYTGTGMQAEQAVKVSFTQIVSKV